MGNDEQEGKLTLAMLVNILEVLSLTDLVIDLLNASSIKISMPTAIMNSRTFLIVEVLPAINAVVILGAMRPLPTNRYQDATPSTV